MIYFQNKIYLSSLIVCVSLTIQPNIKILTWDIVMKAFVYLFVCFFCFSSVVREFTIVQYDNLNESYLILWILCFIYNAVEFVLVPNKISKSTNILLRKPLISEKLNVNDNLLYQNEIFVWTMLLGILEVDIIAELFQWYI